VLKILTTGSLFFALIIMNGCWSISVPIDTPTEFTQAKQSLNALIGSNNREVVALLGEPAWFIPLDDDSTDYLYQWWSKDYDWLWVGPMPSPIVASRDLLQPHCILLKFNKDDVLESYKAETASHDYNCLMVFDLPRSQAQPGSMLEMRRPEILRENAKNGDVRSQFTLYLFEKNNPENIKRLCHLADIGHTKAQIEVARLYWRQDDINNNRSKSYMWYMLAATRGDSEGLYGDEAAQKSAMVEVEYKKQKVLTPEQLKVAIQLLSNWSPGQCEADLIPDNTND
jgi:hypothetical protein